MDGVTEKAPAHIMDCLLRCWHSFSGEAMLGQGEDNIQAWALAKRITALRTKTVSTRRLMKYDTLGELH